MCLFYSGAPTFHPLSTLTTGDGGSTDANGWSLPPTFRAAGDGAAAAGTQAGSAHRASVPIPVYCRPVTDDPSVQVTSLCSDGILWEFRQTDTQSKVSFSGQLGKLTPERLNQSGF